MNKIKIADWLAEDDAYTLLKYAELELDAKRMNAARKAAKKMADDYSKKANNLRKVSNKKVK